MIPVGGRSRPGARMWRPAADVYSCVRSQIPKVGFTQTSYDEPDQRVTARKYNENVTRPDVTFRRLVDRLSVEVRPGPGGADGLSVLEVQAATFAERTTQRGPTEEQEKTSETARQAAQELVDRCSRG